MQIHHTCTCRRQPSPGRRRALIWVLLLGFCWSGTGQAISPEVYEQRLQQVLPLTQQGAWQQAVEAMGTLEDTTPAPPALGRLWFLRATAAQKLQDVETAQHAFTQVWQSYAPLADYAAREMALYYAAKDLLPALQQLSTALAERYPWSRLVPENQLLLARVQKRLGQGSAARPVLERFLQMYPEHASRPEALGLLAQVYEDLGEWLLAAQTLQRLGEAHPRDAQAAQALQRSRELFARVPESQRPPPNPEQLLASVDRFAEAKLWQEVDARMAVLGQFLQPETLVTNVLLKRGALEVRRGRPVEATMAIQDLLQRFPQGPHLPEALYILAQATQRQELHDSAVQQYTAVLTQHPTSPWAAKALWALARFYEEREDLPKAAEYYQRLESAFPTHEHAEASLWQGGWLLYRQRAMQAAAGAWTRFAERFPRSTMLPQVFYWHGRAVQSDGRRETAAQLWQRVLQDYPAHYLSVQAQASLRELGLVPPVLSIVSTSGRPAVLQDPTLLQAGKTDKAKREQFHLGRIRELQSVGMSSQAGQEIRALGALLPSTPPAQYALASLYAENQQYSPVFRMLNSMLETLSPADVRGLPRDFWSILYPLMFWPEVSQQAQATGLNPYLVLGIMKQESAFDPAAVSRSGARGLMQLMPATAQEVVTRAKLPQSVGAQLNDPRNNVTLGTTYFAGLMKRYQGNVVLSLAGYNAGPSRAARWRDQWAGLPMDEFIERIPIEETRNYVKLILRNLMMYERLYKTS